MFSGNPVYSQTTPSNRVEYLYPTNKEKAFDETEDEFYQALRDLKYLVHQEYYRKNYEFFKKHKNNEYGSMNDGIFKDIPHASVNFRKKVLFHELEKFIYVIWDGNGIFIPYPDIKLDRVVSPDRQVYLFYSFRDTAKEFRGRCAVYDVETKQLIAGGAIHMNKYPIEEKNE